MVEYKKMPIWMKGDKCDLVLRELPEEGYMIKAGRADTGGNCYYVFLKE